jgi:hypothetical protein
MRRLLVLACSEHKRLDAGLLPAIDRYDGPTFRVLRHYLQEQPERAPTVWILSAEYGLLSAERLIPYYDRLLDARRAKELRPLVAADVRHILYTNAWSHIGICLGKRYVIAFSEAAEVMREHRNVQYLGGGLGKRLSMLFQWLREAYYGNE